jgi:hypothetical protein
MKCIASNLILKAPGGPSVIGVHSVHVVAPLHQGCQITAELKAKLWAQQAIGSGSRKLIKTINILSHNFNFIYYNCLLHTLSRVVISSK